MLWQASKNVYHLFVAVLANTYYGFPAKKLKVIGVTGTDGKTTTTSLIYHILKTANHTASLVSTISAVVGEKQYDTGFHVTTPSSVSLQKFVKKATLGEYLVLEVTSHALHQNRSWGIPFSIGVLTNISHEHLDYHQTYENYARAKSKLLLNAKVAIINKDDISYKLIMQILTAAKYKGKIVTYGMQDADITPKMFPFESNLIGAFNTYNILAAVAVSKVIGLDEDAIRTAIASFVSPSGRQEVIYDKDFRIIIDFAHTPNAFTQLLPEIKKTTTGRLIHIFGAPSQRDTTKRPLMGEASAKFADIVILTAEDPRGVPVSTINKEIAKGITSSHAKVMQFENRKDAITHAIAIAQKGDTILLTGKGHETSINYGQGEQPWSEKGAVEEALKMVER